MLLRREKEKEKEAVSTPTRKRKQPKQQYHFYLHRPSSGFPHQATAVLVVAAVVASSRGRRSPVAEFFSPAFSPTLTTLIRQTLILNPKRKRWTGKRKRWGKGAMGVVVVAKRAAVVAEGVAMAAVEEKEVELAITVV
jgi:hypothetical protein